MAKQKVIYAVSGLSFVQFFRKSRAVIFAKAINGLVLCFDQESVRVWRGVSSIEHASIGMEPMTTQEAEALSTIGSNAGVISIIDYCHTTRVQRVIMGNITQQIKKT